RRSLSASPETPQTSGRRFKVSVCTSRRWLGTALFGLALGCGGTTDDGTPRGAGGSAVTEQAGSAAGGRLPSASGGVASGAGAGAGGNSHTASGSSSVAGSGGTGEDPNKIVLFDGSQQTFDSWYPLNGGMKAANPWTNNGDGTM